MTFIATLGGHFMMAASANIYYIAIDFIIKLMWK